MNNIGEFFVTFTTKGIEELKDGLKDINIKLDSLNTSFTKSSSAGDSFFSKFTSWGLKLTALAAGFVSVGKAINDAFKIGGEITALNVSADVAGVKAEQVEALAIALAPLRGGRKDFNDAANFYKNMTETQTKWWRGQYSKQVIEEMARAGVTGLKADSSPEQWMSGIIQALSYYQGQHTQQAIGARNLFAQAFGLSNEQMLLFAEGQDYVNQQLEYGYKHLTLSGEGNLRKAMEQTRAKMEFQESWDNLVKELMQYTTKLYQLLKPMVDSITAFLQSEAFQQFKDTMVFLAGEFKNGWNILTSTVKELWERLKEAFPSFEDQPAVIKAINRSNKTQMAFADLQDGRATAKQVALLLESFKNEGALTPELENAFQNEYNKLASQGWAVMADPSIRDMKKKFAYDPNISLANMLLKSANTSLNTFKGRNGDTNNTANFGNIYVTGAENTGKVVKGQLNAAINSMGEK